MLNKIFDYIPAIFGITFTAVGCTLLFFLGQGTVLECERLNSRSVTCYKQNSLLGLVQLSERTLTEVQEAWVEEDCDEGCTYRVVLETGDGTVPLTNFYTSAEQAKYDLAGQVNAFLDSRQPSLRVKETPGFVLLLIPVIFLVLGPTLGVGVWWLMRDS